ncbi:hypothetical protein NC651_016065 [Populus alba x Populus x berolinensis]|nr:hypothetical protein NC651_016065 [Populus alba x Populus x berolinensis]
MGATKSVYIAFLLFLFFLHASFV